MSLFSTVFITIRFHEEVDYFCLLLPKQLRTFNIPWHKDDDVQYVPFFQLYLYRLHGNRHTFGHYRLEIYFLDF